ncbi:uncharacterized protein A4U43_C06F16740 [Asparagus officinalis]|uniref:MADS-box domain-containing protein n=1 Tax=Asparagus officinalis TaxID=4686 RepID=A0A5P1EMD6_ASPOF|nr:agamous-like MADS-box protein AGL81 [Asparagus officinalis]ONK67168.1 uncharacterized protein A4U43_C06F16740 [Asparagus officinalis]
MSSDIALKDNARLRRATFRKRERTLKKNARELSALCGTPTLLILFGPEEEIITWPEKLCETKDIIKEYQELSRHASNKHNFTLSDYLQRRKMKDHERTTTRVDDITSFEEAKEAIRSIDSTLKEVEKRMNFLSLDKNLENAAIEEEEIEPNFEFGSVLTHNSDEDGDDTMEEFASTSTEENTKQIASTSTEENMKKITSREEKGKEITSALTKERMQTVRLFGKEITVRE